MLDIEFDDFELGNKRPPPQWVAVAPPVNPRHAQRSVSPATLQECHFLGVGSCSHFALYHLKKLSRSQYRSTRALARVSVPHHTSRLLFGLRQPASTARSSSNMTPMGLTHREQRTTTPGHKCITCCVHAGRSNGKHRQRIRVRGGSAGAAADDRLPQDGSSSAPVYSGTAAGLRSGNGPNCESRRCRRERLAAEADPAAAQASAQVIHD